MGFPSAFLSRLLLLLLLSLSPPAPVMPMGVGVGASIPLAVVVAATGAAVGAGALPDAALALACFGAICCASHENGSITDIHNQRQNGERSKSVGWPCVGPKE